MKIENERLNERILNFSESVKRRNEVAEYYFEHGIQETMNHYKITKQGVYSDVRVYKKFMTAYNLISNIKTKKEFLNLNAKELLPLFNNPRIGRFLNQDCKLKELNFKNTAWIRRRISGEKSICQFEEFMQQYSDMLK